MEFLRLMFQQIHNRRVPEPNEQSITSIQSAIFSLRECTGMSREYLGKRIGLSTTQMVNVESRGKLPLQSLSRLIQISEEYNLNQLSNYFRNQELLFNASRRPKLRGGTVGF